MELSLFSQSLFALNLSEAITATAEIGFPAIELACTPPYFDLERARREPERVACEIKEKGTSHIFARMYRQIQSG